MIDLSAAKVTSLLFYIIKHCTIAVLTRNQSKMLRLSRR